MNVFPQISSPLLLTSLHGLLLQFFRVMAVYKPTYTGTKTGQAANREDGVDRV